jgi:predicted DNA-binding transcriptional regulator YafY
MEQLFRQRTDETHALTGNQLIDILGSMGIKAERKTIYDDIATLCDAGLDIRTTKIGHSNAYYLGERLFNDEELMILADAAASSRFLTIKKSNELIKKLQTLTSEYKSPALRRSIHIESRTKSFSETVFNAVNVLQEAVFADREVEFVYSEMPQLGEKRRAGKRSEETVSISPYQLVWEGEYYYIICYSESERKMCRYRVDRMQEVTLTERKRHSLSESDEQQLRSLKSGESAAKEQLKIRFDNSMLEAVTERFGDKIPLKPDGDSHFTAETEVCLSPEFWGWIFGFGEKVRILEPDYVAENACEKLKKIEQLYGE